MLEITVIGRQGIADPAGAKVQFGADGGTIGRADTNRLVLDDPDRTVSRVHAQVICREGAYVIVDRGSNPTHINGRPLGNGNEAPLNPGDRLTMGGFELMVSDRGGLPAPGPEPMNAPETQNSWSSSTSVDDPFADLLEGLAPAPSPPPAPAPTALADDGLFPDPLGMNAPVVSDPFSDLLGSSSSGQFGGSSPQQEPEDFSDLIAPSRGAKAESIDALFGLDASSGTDPLAMTPLADPLFQPNTASAQDPLAALSRPQPEHPSVRSDHLPLGQFGFVPPSIETHGATLEPTVASNRPDENDPFADFQATAFAPTPANVVNTTDSPTARDSAPERPPVAPEPWATPPAHSAQPAGQHAPASSDHSSEHELLAALLRGLGPLQQTPVQLTPALMERLGVLLRAATEGTLQLLLTRQEFKHELRAQATMIAAQANNPLKFSPTVEVALAHLLGPGMRGFMPAEAAMRDAYQDLRAHEFGVMVGMRAALAHVIERFEPALLEKNIVSRSRLDTFFSSNRKARLWDQFITLYGSIAKEAEDDFHSLFGKAFLKAYEEQLSRLNSRDARRDT